MMILFQGSLVYSPAQVMHRSPRPVAIAPMLKLAHYTPCERLFRLWTLIPR